MDCNCQVLVYTVVLVLVVLTAIAIATRTPTKQAEGTLLIISPQSGTVHEVLYVRIDGTSRRARKEQEGREGGMATSVRYSTHSHTYLLYSKVAARAASYCMYCTRIDAVKKRRQ
jgi:hypothetical protein